MHVYERKTPDLKAIRKERIKQHGRKNSTAFLIGQLFVIHNRKMEEHLTSMNGINVINSEYNLLIEKDGLGYLPLFRWMDI